jgi:hypothetical protein
MESNIFANNILGIQNMNDNQLLCELTSIFNLNDVPLRFFSTLHLGYFPSANKTFSQQNL